MSGREGWSQEAKQRAASAHAKHAYYCTCGRVVHGNGGRANHFRPDLPEGRAGHVEISQSDWKKRTYFEANARGVHEIMADGKCSQGCPGTWVPLVVDIFP